MTILKTHQSKIDFAKEQFETYDELLKAYVDLEKACQNKLLESELSEIEKAEIRIKLYNSKIESFQAKANITTLNFEIDQLNLHKKALEEQYDLLGIEMDESWDEYIDKLKVKIRDLQRRNKPAQAMHDLLNRAISEFEGREEKIEFFRALKNVVDAK